MDPAPATVLTVSAAPGRRGPEDRAALVPGERPGAAAGNVRPVPTPGTHSRRTGRKPKYIQYDDFR
ncbi:hypothetical protein AB0D59_45945, partial [Streptomyces sp. NPDC048417]|uniref:hypothetical protein n=1 Tax=Streptomyces sp. NPDC048417 TaxID=3155387 RepID=UPI003427E3AC